MQLVSAIAQVELQGLVCWHKLTVALLAQVCTILSQNTTDVNSARAFANLKQKFPEWEMVRTAENGTLG